MKAAYSEAVNEALEAAPAAVRKAFFQTDKFPGSESPTSLFARQEVRRS
jgi:hypothetical protein